MKTSLWQNIRLNWKSGLTVSLVAIPLSISLAIAGGATPTQGIITAIWAGLIAAILGGSNFNIVGPTGALSGLLATFAFLHGGQYLPLLAIAVGIIVLLAWVLRLERYLIFIPANTIQGFTLGVAFVIAFNQFNFAFGLSGLPKHEAFIDNLVESFRHVGGLSMTAVIVFAIFLAGMFLVPRLWKLMPKLPIVPPAAILAPIGMLLGYLAETHRIPLTLQTLGSRYADIAPKLFVVPDFHFGLSSGFVVTALTVALIAILETMLSAKIADGLTKTKHDKRKEMFGLGVANLASGFAGGIPATAALARTALNIKSGASHKTSAGLSAIFVAVISLFLLGFFKYIPLPVIAAILVTVAIRMIEREHFIRMWQIDRKSFAIAMIVAAITIYEDPIIGILVGVACSLLLFLDTLSRGQFDLVVNDINKKIVGQVSGEKIKELSEQSHTLVYSIKGHLTYINSQAHLARFEEDLSRYEHVVLRMRELSFVDLDGVDVLEEIIQNIQKSGKKVYVSGANEVVLPMLRHSHAFVALEAAGHVYPHTSDALRALGFSLGLQHEHR